jgi:hypothetical protein
VHYNIGAFSVPAGQTNYVYRWNGGDSSGQIRVQARLVTVGGAIVADGRGYGGGGGGQNDFRHRRGGSGGVNGRGGAGAPGTWDTLLYANSGGGGGGSPLGLPGRGGYRSGDTGRIAAGGRGGNARPGLFYGGSNGGLGGPGHGGGGGGGAGYYSAGGGGGGGGTGGALADWIFGGAGAGLFGGFGGLGADTIADTLLPPNPPTCGADGGYLDYRLNGDTTTDGSVFRGSGGGGSGSSFGLLEVDSVNGGGGGGGGAGGAAISLEAQDTLVVSGTISTQGAGGGQAGGFFDTVFGGGGAGGGILLSGHTLQLSGTIDARGRHRQDLSSVNGGTLKVFYWTLANTMTCYAGRYYPRGSAPFDVGTIAILAPVGPVDSGLTYAPQALLHNFGTMEASFGIEFRIADGYFQTADLTLAAGADTVLELPDWTPETTGTFAVQCTTLGTNDADPSNDKAVAEVTVQVHDLAVNEILSPVGAIPPVLTTPQVLLRNRGTQPESLVGAIFRIELADYAETLALTNPVSPGQDTLVLFPSFIPQVGFYTAQCTILHFLDRIPDNNSAFADFSVDSVGRADIGVTRIVAPADSSDTGRTILPTIWTQNFGRVAASFQLFFRITDTSGAEAYRADTMVRELNGHDSTLVILDAWPKPHLPNIYVAFCSTYLAGDANNSNDVIRSTFCIYAPPPESAWRRLADLPAGPRAKRVKDGGSLAARPGPDTSYVFALKGGNTCEFYRYNTVANVWVSLESIPAFGSLGKRKTVKRGASLADADGSLYAAKGGSSLEWWRYRPLADSPSAYPWRELTSVPLGAKTCRDGCGAATVQVGDTSYVYFLKASSTDEFYRYNVPADAWQPMATAPLGLSGKPFKTGTCLTVSGDTIIYALKGNHNEFFRYRVDSNTWSTEPSLPFVGNSTRKKRAKAGAALALYGVTVFAQKGGNTQEFWQYRTDFSRWLQGVDFPLGDGRKVKGGGALLALSNYLYAFKGNNTCEFWRYDPAGVLDAPAAGPNVAAAPGVLPRRLGLSASPNPFTGATAVRYTLPVAGNYSLKLYDITGQLKAALAEGYGRAGSYSLTIGHSLPARGIYFLKLEAAGTTLTRKLIRTR